MEGELGEGGYHPELLKEISRCRMVRIRVPLQNVQKLIDIQVLVDGPEYLHNGAILLPPIPHLQRPHQKHLPGHQRVQPPKHNPPFPLRPP